MAEQAERVTEEQANAALQQLAQREESEPVAVPEVEEPQSEPVEAEAPAETQEATQEAADDDIESLRKRLADIEARDEEREKLSKSRLEAMQQRFSQNEQVLRDRYVRKSTVTDKLLKMLEQAKTESGVDPADVERMIAEAKATMNPASASYVPPAETSLTNEDHVIVLNSFLNEKAMGTDEAEEFGKWLRGDASSALSPIEQAVAGRDLDGFLRIAHGRFLEGKRERDKQAQRADAVGAVRSVQRTQREAARAASAPTASPKKQPTGAKTEMDHKKLTKDDISTLLRQTVEQYR